MDAAPPPSGPEAHDARPPDNASRTRTASAGNTLLILAIVAAVTGIAATIVSVWLTDPAASIGVISGAMPWIALASVAVALVIGIVLLERRIRTGAVVITVVAAAALAAPPAAASMQPLPDLAAHVYGYACPFYAPNLRDTGTDPTVPLPFGSTIGVSADSPAADSGSPVPWTTFTVGQPIDVTAEARKAAQRPPRSGSYFAVVVRRGKADASIMQCDDPLNAQAHWLVDGGGRLADTPLTIPGYAAANARDDGTVTYTLFFDITRDTAHSGRFILDLLPPGDGPGEAFWGGNGAGITIPGVAPSSTPSPEPSASNPPAAVDPTQVYVKDRSAAGSDSGSPLPYGSARTMQSVTTGKDALKFVVGAPIDITEKAIAGGAPAPQEGAYIALPITATEIDPQAISDANGTNYPVGVWFPPGKDGIDRIASKIAGYPALEDITAPGTDGAWHYYEIFDAPPDSVASGQYGLELELPDGSGQYWFWGAAQ